MYLSREIDKVLSDLTAHGFAIDQPSFMVHNLSNISYRAVFDGKDIVIKIFCADYATSRMENEVRGTKIAEAVGMPVPAVYFHNVLSDGLSYLVKQFVNGESIPDLCKRLKVHKLDVIESSGGLLAKLHTAQTDEFKNKGDADTTFVETYLGGLEREIKLKAKLCKDKKIQTLAEKFFSYFNEQNLKLDNCCFVHGDYKFSNVITDGTSIVAIIDWEQSKYGLAMEDVGRVSVFPEDAVTAFLKGYRAVSDMPLANIELFRDLFYVWTIARFSARKHLCDNLNPEKVAAFEPHVNLVLESLLGKYE